LNLANATLSLSESVSRLLTGPVFKIEEVLGSVQVTINKQLNVRISSQLFDAIREAGACQNLSPSNYAIAALQYCVKHNISFLPGGVAPAREATPIDIIGTVNEILREFRAEVRLDNIPTKAIQDQINYLRNLDEIVAFMAITKKDIVEAIAAEGYTDSQKNIEIAIDEIHEMIGTKDQDKAKDFFLESAINRSMIYHTLD
jgi:hypothetical protein